MEPEENPKSGGGEKCDVYSARDLALSPRATVIFFGRNQRGVARIRPVRNIDDPNDAREYKLGTSFDSPHFGERPIVETFQNLLYRYFYHPEAKSLGPDGERCHPKTRGRLVRPHVIGGKHHHIGKEVDRRWEEGDDLDAMRQTPIEYTQRASRAPCEPLAQPSLSLSRLVKNLGIRKLIRQGFGPTHHRQNKPSRTLECLGVSRL